MNDAQQLHLTALRLLFQSATDISICVNEVNIMGIIVQLGEWTSR
jgi:hypothetical protein